MISTPLLLLADAPDSTSGLGRIGHDLAWLLSSMPEFRVGYLARGGFGRARFPWAQYSFHPSEQWGEHRIESAWEDLSQGQRGVIFTVWDASRLLWFADPTYLPDGRLKQFLQSDRFERWGYFMQDSSGVNPHLLPHTAAHVMAQYDRVLLASRWAYNLAINTVRDHPDIDWMPHGINTQTFSPVDRVYGRSALKVPVNALLVGAVMTNQDRKHWNTVFELIASMPEKPYLWARVDEVVRYWNIEALAYEYGVQDRVIVETQPLSDKELAMRYSACDVTVLISGGEGFGYPIAESMACGVPCVTGEYGGGAELSECPVPPTFERVETMHNARRAYYSASDVASIVRFALEEHKSETAQGWVEHLNWHNLKHPWMKWLRRKPQ